MFPFIAIPAYTGSLTVQCAASLFAGLGDLARRGIVAEVRFLAGLCYIDIARDKMAAEFLASDCTDLVFLDDDVGFPPDGLWQILRHDRAIVGGVYPKKRDDLQWPFKPLRSPEGNYVMDDDGLLECSALPTGFLRISRKALETMIAAMPERAYSDDEGQALHDLFPRDRIDGRKRGEDYGFCALARDCGLKLFCEPDLTLTHTGQHTWTGNYDSFVRAHG